MAADSEPELERSDRLDELEGAVSALGRAIRGFAEEIRTRQLVVVDDDDRPRIVGEVFADVAELRLELPSAAGEPGAELLLFAVSSTRPGPFELGPAIGLQLRAQGQAVFELDAWPGSDGTWRPHLHMSGA